MVSQVSLKEAGRENPGSAHGGVQSSVGLGGGQPVVGGKERRGRGSQRNILWGEPGKTELPLAGGPPPR